MVEDFQFLLLYPSLSTPVVYVNFTCAPSPTLPLTCYGSPPHVVPLVYFDRVARYDRETFTGKVSWANIKASGPLPAPFVEQVVARGEDRDALRGNSGYGNGGTGSGDQVMEEGLEEEE
ncbi:hypothetical protein DFH28DRAFT_1121827 [Melampsora americana]|nr:hypothetical protein DFH28DRAFT_1121827 [Melampsora americana]